MQYATEIGFVREGNAWRASALKGVPNNYGPGDDAVVLTTQAALFLLPDPGQTPMLQLGCYSGKVRVFYTCASRKAVQDYCREYLTTDVSSVPMVACERLATSKDYGPGKVVFNEWSAGVVSHLQESATTDFFEAPVTALLVFFLDGDDGAPTGVAHVLTA